MTAVDVSFPITFDEDANALLAMDPLALLFGIAAPPAPRGTARPGERRLDATLRALDPVAMLAVLARARGEHLIALGPSAATASVHLAAHVTAARCAGLRRARYAARARSRRADGVEVARPRAARPDLAAARPRRGGTSLARRLAMPQPSARCRRRAS